MLLALAGGVAGARADAPPIRLGEYGSLTGSEATFGISTRDAIDLAISEINAAGGVKGRKLEIVLYDDQGKTQEAATVVTCLVTQDKVVAVLGEVASPRSLAAAPICQQHGVPMLSPSSTNRKVTEVGDAIFRVCFIDPFQGSVMAKFAFDALGARRVAVLHDVRNAYSMGLSEYFIATFTRLGGVIVDTASYSSGDSNFKAQLIALRSAGADLLYVPGFYTEGALIARQARALGITAPLLGGDGWDSEALPQIAGPAADGIYFSTHYFSDDPRPEVQRFVAAYRQRFGTLPDGLGALAYDAARLLADAIARIPGEEVTPAAIKEQLRATRDFAGVTGRITINRERNADKPAVVVRVDGSGKFVYQQSISADDIAEALRRPVPAMPAATRRPRALLSDVLQHLIEGLSLGAAYALVALGYSLVYGVLGFINFAHAELFMLGAFFSFFVARRWPGPSGLALALLVAMLGAALAAVATERIAYRPLRAANKLKVLISAIGVSLFLQNLAQLLFGAAPRGFPLLISDRPIVGLGTGALGVSISRLQALGLGGTALCLVALLLLVYRTRLGLAMRAVATDPRWATLMGIDVGRVIAVTFLLGGALAGAGGLVIGQMYGSIRPDMGTLWGIKAFVAAVVGGIGSLPGAMLGALLLGLAEELTAGFLSSTWRDAIAFALLIGVLWLRPSGLLGRAQRDKL